MIEPANASRGRGHPPKVPKPSQAHYVMALQLRQLMSRLNELGVKDLSSLVSFDRASKNDRWLNKVLHGTGLLTTEELALLVEWPGASIADLERVGLSSDHPAQHGLTHAERFGLVLGDIRWQRLTTPRKRPSAKTQPRDVYGIGAMNYDVIIPKSAYPPLSDEVKASSEAVGLTFSTSEERRFETREKIYEELYSQLLELTPDGLAKVIETHGGSTFNVMRMLSTPELGISTGYVGVSGIVPPLPDDIPGIENVTRVTESHRGVLKGAGVNCAYVWPIDDLGGLCISSVRPKGDNVVNREMSTWDGINGALPKYLLDNFWDIAEALKTAKIVHVTSIFDDVSPTVIAELLEYVTASSDVLVSFDPGHDWSSVKQDVVGRLLEQTSLLFVNQHELRAIAHNYCGPVIGNGESVQARHVLEGMREGAQSAVIVVKHKGETAIYTLDDLNREPLKIDALEYDQIEDDTGAGDVFAAGFIAGLVSTKVHQRAGAYLGMHLARTKLQQVGPTTPGEVINSLSELRAV